MTRKGQLAPGAEDSNPIVGGGRLGRQQKGGLGQVGPIGKCLHLLGGQALAIEHHRKRIAHKGSTRKHVDLHKAAGAWD
jgi:hypothetical protein